MEESGACDLDQHEGYKRKLSLRMSKDEEEDLKEEDEEDFKIKTMVIPKFKRRKQPSLNQLGEMKELLDGEQAQCISKLKTKKHQSRNRWSVERYQQAEQRMWEVLKVAGANFANPISRHALRNAARKHIGDTGLLDHLLKQIDGKIAPGGTDRFRRWHNPKGIMEYWLESAHLDKVRQEAGVQDPYWLPPSNFSAGNNAPSQNTDSSCELKLLQVEMAKMKRDMQELILKKQEKNEHNPMEGTQNELVKLKAMTEERLTGITTSLKGMQGMYGELVTWKTKVDQQLAEIANKLNDLQTPQEQTTTGFPSEEWEGWLENINLDNIPEDGLAAWLGSTELPDSQQEVALHDPILPLPSPQCNKELNDTRSNLLEFNTKRKEEDQPDVTPCSSMTVSPKSDLDNNTFIVFQGMLMELFKWKDKMEQQLLEVSNSVHMLAMKYTTA